MHFRLRIKPADAKEGLGPTELGAAQFLRWAKESFTGAADDPLIAIVQEVFSLKRLGAVWLLTGEVNALVEGTDILVEWPCNDVFTIELGE
jgi:hypothetical protein